MRLFNNLRLVNKFMVISGLFALGLISFGVGAFATLETLRINGSQYKRIVQGKDLIADILPPPVYLLEAYLVAFQAANEPDPKQAEALLARLGALGDDYQTRHDFWGKDLEEGPLKNQLLVNAHEPAKAFLDLASKDLMTLVRSRDLQAARNLVSGPLKQRYEEHRSAIDAAVKLATARNAEDERQAADLIRSRSLLLLAFAAGTLGALFVVSLLVGRELSRSMAVMVASLVELGRGHIQGARELLHRIES